MSVFGIPLMTDEFRALAEAAMTDTALVVRPIYSDDSGSGGGTRIDQVVYDGKCRFVPNTSGTLASLAQRPDSVVSALIHFPHGTDIQTGDSIEINANARYEAVAPDAPKTNDYDVAVAARYHSPVVA